MSIDPNNLSGTATLTFSEEFNGNSLDASVWNTAYPWNAANGGTNLSNKEEQWYINSNYGPTAALAADTYQVKDGMLHIKAQPTPSGYKQHVDGYNYTSGMITTHDKFEQTYGYFEMRADIPSGKGMWPAFWLLQPGNWPPEIDIMEVIGSRPDHLETFVHYSDGGHQRQGNTTYYPGLSDGFQTYGVNWQADTITWYLNGKEVFKVNTPADLHDPMYMLVNLAVGGSWPGSPDANTQFPATMSIDYIRAYSELPEGMVPPPVVPDAEDEADEVVGEVVDEVIEENSAVEEDASEGETEDGSVDGEQQEEAPKANPDADDAVAELPEKVEPVEDEADLVDEIELELEDDSEVEDENDTAFEDELVDSPETERPVAEVEVPADVEEIVVDETPIAAAPDTGNGRSPANWDKFIEAFAGFGKNSAGNDGWSKMADKFSNKADKFTAKAEEFAAKKAGIADKMLAKKTVFEGNDDAIDFSASSVSGRDMSKVFKGSGFEVGNTKLDFGSRMEAIGDRIAAFQDKGMSSQAQKFQDLNMGDFDLNKSFAEGIAEQAVSQSAFDFA
jgi:beta-glucanase (GH16 family)